MEKFCAIVGSRTLQPSPRRIGEVLRLNCLEVLTGEMQLISGGAKGVDTMARKFADALNIPILEIRPDYQQYGKKTAPFVRNRQIVDTADIVIAFWDGYSPGTHDVIRYACDTDTPAIVICLSQGPSKE